MGSDSCRFNMDVQHVQNTTMACANFSCATCSDCLCKFDPQNSFQERSTSGFKWWDLNCACPQKDCMEGFFLLRFCHCHIWYNLAYSHSGIRLEISHLDAEKNEKPRENGGFQWTNRFQTMRWPSGKISWFPPFQNMPVEIFWSSFSQRASWSQSFEEPWLSSQIMGSVKNGCVS